MRRRNRRPTRSDKSSGLLIVRNDRNEGFIRSSNRGAREARGRFLLFLNNDTEVMPRWCDELVATFETVPSAGIVGAKLLYPDGALQEAGGVIWRDGSAWNYGKFEDPARPGTRIVAKSITSRERRS